MTDIYIYPMLNRKKRGRRKCFGKAIVFFGLLLMLLLNMSGIVSLRAEETSDGKEELNQSILEQIGELDLEALQEYIDSLGSFSDKNVGERIWEYIQGDQFDYGSFAGQMLNVLFADVREMLPAFACICAIALLCGILSSVKSNFADQTSADMIFLISYAAALIPVLPVLTECFSKAGESITSKREQKQIVYPL